MLLIKANLKFQQRSHILVEKPGTEENEVKPGMKEGRKHEDLQRQSGQG